MSKRISKSQSVLFAVSEDQSQNSETISDVLDQENDNRNGDIPLVSNSYVLFDGTGGKPGLISFYNRPYKREDEVSIDTPEKKSNLLWLVGPAVLVASFIFPSLYLRKLILTIFEDSLLTGEGASISMSFLLYIF